MVMEGDIGDASVATSSQPKLIDFGRTSHVTQRGLCAVLEQVKEEGLPSTLSRRSFMREITARVHEDTRHGPLHTHVNVMGNDGVPFEIPVTNPMALLSVVVKECPAFRSRLSEALSKSAVMDMIAYTDDITCGNPKAVSNDRKIACIYWSILQLPRYALSSEFFWFTAVTLRKSVVNKIAGGLGQVWRAVLRLFFGGDGAPDFRKHIHIYIYRKRDICVYLYAYIYKHIYIYQHICIQLYHNAYACTSAYMHT